MHAAPNFWNDAENIIKFSSSHPEKILGPHLVKEGSEVRFFLPRSTRAWIECAGKRIEVSNIGNGLYAGTIPTSSGRQYLICWEDSSGYVSRSHDPYAFAPLLTDLDAYLFKKGEDYMAYRVFGAHSTKYPEAKGTRFVVWAPNALAVSVIGNFNHWNSGEHPMINVKDSGIWEIFIPECVDGEVYKFAMKTQQGTVVEKTDPFAARAELRPRTASIVHNTTFRWKDRLWLDRRADLVAAETPMSIYEVHLGSWARSSDGGYLNYRDLAPLIADHMNRMGFTHVELLPVMEHPFDGSWGYQVINYYAPTSRYGSPDDFRFFINYMHSRSIGVILDWVPAHFPEDAYGLAEFDGTHLFEDPDPRKGRHPDWGTYIFNYGSGGVTSFLVSNAVYWLEMFHADGIRIDAVSSMLYLDYSRKPGEWIPNAYGGNQNLEAIEFLRKVNGTVHSRFPGALMIAEESTSWPNVTGPISSGGLGFDMKWNMGWMHDTLDFFSTDPLYKKYRMDNLTFSVWYAFSEKFVLPISHDEVVHGKGSLYGKMPGDAWQKHANIRLLLSYMFSFPGKKLLFMGNETAMEKEWNYASPLPIDADDAVQSGIMLLLHDLNEIYKKYELGKSDFSPERFRWIDFKDSENTVISFMRQSAGESENILFIFNFTPVVRYNYRIGVPKSGKYMEILNSDASVYGGSGVGNFGLTESQNIPMHGLENSVEMTLPPLGCIILKNGSGDMNEDR
ncbi:MAG: 1,4-alpha-glucan branching protein GlgB [Candidatus Thermoplasmatota archaeon]|nr:1,4-alpha-glucan branching protein GlgB [Candidatus Thermoplasmatota archaeon]MCL5881163.1 1,4-alpha-glucan branching protein GlgB [Candidatus Thermoplasmatota archaeon]